MTLQTRRLRIGHTAITWDDDHIEDAVRTISRLGYEGIEVFSWTLGALRDEGKLDLFETYDIPLVSSYFSVDIVDPRKRSGESAKLEDWGRLVASLGAGAATLGGNGVDRRSFDFAEHRAYIVRTVNEMGSRLADLGLALNFHPHTGTPVETEGEIRSLLDGVDASHVGFAPDVGQIQKGGADPIRLLEEYLPMVGLVHLKDFCGTVRFDDNGEEVDSSGFVGYTPLGRGAVDLARALDLLEASSYEGYIMVELDRGRNMPMSAEEAVGINTEYLESRGYTFRHRSG